MLDSDAPPRDTPAGPPSARRLTAWALVPLAAVGWWVGGFLPSTLADLRVPGPIFPGGWPAVPLLASQLAVLVAGSFAGGLLAGLLGRVARPAPRWVVLAGTAAGTALAMTAALVQARSVLADQAGFDGDHRVLAGLCLLTVGAGTIGWMLGSLAVLGRVGLGIALAALATAVPGWVSALQRALLPAGEFGYVSIDGRWGEWLGAAALAASLVVIGVRPPGRLGWWPVALVGAWFVAPVTTALVYLEVYLRPGAGLPGTLPEALAAARQVFGEAALPSNRPLAPWIAAVVVAVLLCAARPHLRRPLAPAT
jgi:hypothetical protein